MFVRISKFKKNSEITSLSKTPDFCRIFRKTYDRLKTANYINKEITVLMRESEKFTTENKIFCKEIKGLREAIFKEKRKRKREKILNFHEKDEMED
jgi:hypothetical protein